jgi:CelD/BcsL family acetyltransferase involved in cellulose biosynthesis
MKIWRQEDFAKAAALGHANGMAGALDAQPPAALALLHPADLTAQDHAAWVALADQAGTANVFAQPWLMKASLTHCDPLGNAVLAVVQDPDGAWIGAIPLERKLWHGRLPMPHWRGWSHANQFCATPLVRRGRATDFWRGLLCGLDAAPRGCVVLSLAGLALDEHANRALVDLCQIEGRAFALDQLTARPSLEASPANLALYNAACTPKQRRRRDSLIRRLESEYGPVSFTIARDPEAIAALVEPFLRIEASGWKGEEGSAMASDPATRAFFVDVARAGASHGQFELAILAAGSQTLAMTSYFVCEGWSYGFKMGFDGGAARHAPGALLLDRLTRSLCERGIGRFDSCTVPGNDPVNRLWTGRRELMDCRVAIGAGMRKLAVRLLASGEEFYHALKA